MKKKIFIDGMSCRHCINHVNEALKEFKEVSDVDVVLEEKYAVVTLTEEIKDESIREVLKNFGYTLIKVESI